MMSINILCVQVLLSMGISENAASRGLYHTGNTNPELAAAWVFEHLEDPHLHDPFHPPPLPPSPSPSLPSLSMESRSLKMVFVVNTSIGMGIGKIASQVSHATLALYKTLLLSPSEQRVLEEWEVGGAKKIVLKGRDVDHLKELEEETKKRNIPHFMISDAGMYMYMHMYMYISTLNTYVHVSAYIHAPAVDYMTTLNVLVVYCIPCTVYPLYNVQCILYIMYSVSSI